MSQPVDQMENSGVEVDTIVKVEVNADIPESAKSLCTISSTHTSKKQTEEEEGQGKAIEESTRSVQGVDADGSEREPPFGAPSPVLDASNDDEWSNDSLKCQRDEQRSCEHGWHCDDVCGSCWQWSTDARENFRQMSSRRHRIYHRRVVRKCLQSLVPLQ